MNETITPTPLKAGMTLGILFGVIMILQFIIAYVMNIDAMTAPAYGWTINILNYLVLPALFISLACKNFKRLNNGFISFGQCLKTGVALCVIAGIIAAVFSVIFGLIFPEFMEETLRKAEQVMIEQNPQMTAEQVEMGMSWARKLSNPALVIPFSVLMYAFLGLIHSLIIGAIVKNDKPESF